MAVTPEQKAERIAKADRSVARTKEAFEKLKVRYQKAETAYQEAVWRRACLESLPVAGQAPLAAVPPWEQSAPQPAVAEAITNVVELAAEREARGQDAPHVSLSERCHSLDEQLQPVRQSDCTHFYDDAVGEWILDFTPPNGSLTIEPPADVRDLLTTGAAIASGTVTLNSDNVVVNENGDTAADVAAGVASAARAHDERVAADTKAYEASLAAAEEQKAKPSMTEAQRAAVAAARARRAAHTVQTDPFGAPAKGD